jgi:hypothetical protein
MRLFELPDFLIGKIDRRNYVRWLQRKAAAHVRRDRRRGNSKASVSEYKRAIHNAVCKSGDRDFYTSEHLDWNLISTYNNEASKKGGRAYKRRFALLPTVDHVGDGKGPADFVICAWRTNDAKGDLTYTEFVEVCRRVIEGSRETSRATDLEAIVDLLNKHGQRATYGAIAGLLDRDAERLMTGLPRSQRYSWVVSRLGWPTRYPKELIHPDLTKRPRVIRTKNELERWIRNPN